MLTFREAIVRQIKDFFVKSLHKMELVFVCESQGVYLVHLNDKRASPRNSSEQGLVNWLDILLAQSGMNLQHLQIRRLVNSKHIQIVFQILFSSDNF